MIRVSIENTVSDSIRLFQAPLRGRSFKWDGSPPVLTLAWGMVSSLSHCFPEHIAHLGGNTYRHLMTVQLGGSKLLTVSTTFAVSPWVRDFQPHPSQPAFRLTTELRLNLLVASNGVSNISLAVYRQCSQLRPTALAYQGLYR